MKKEFCDESQPLTIETTEEIVYRELLCITTSEYASSIANNIAKEVMEDIVESADTNFNSNDIHLAIGRVLERLTAMGK